MMTEEFTKTDLKNITALQPEGWLDIIPFFKFYLDYPFCYPIKIKIKNRIVGIGTSIVFRNTAWLAHIIVHPDYRNKGFGSEIVTALLNKLKNLPCSTVLLIATEMGEPIYRKAGFKTDTEYFFLKGGIVKDEVVPPKEIISYDESYKNTILLLDKRISGEIRKNILLDHLPGSKLFVKQGKLLGYYLSTLGEGLIVADATEAGIELMKIKYSTISKASLPIDNKAGVEFLLKNNFVKTRKALRMRLGKKITWYPDKLFSRIGGHVG